MGEWRTETLTECLSALIDYRGKSPPKSVTGIPVLSAKVVKSTGLLRPIEQTIEQDYYPKWMTRGLPRPGDVVMTTEGPMGEVIQLDGETAQYALGQRIVCMRGDPEKLDNTFLRYRLISPIQQEILASYATGTTVLGISQKALRSMPISFPCLDEQRDIAQILAALDDKIELNRRRMNETLEAMARAIFKDWFVDFGPTRAKAEGRRPYLAPDLWALFPDTFNDDDKPMGWGAESVLDQAHWVNGAAYKNMHFTAEADALPVIKIAELKAGVTKSTKFTSTALGEKFRISNGELLFSWSGNPDTSIDTFIWTGGDAWLNQHIFAVRQNGKKSKAFLYSMLRWLKPEFAEIARNKQTTGLGHVTRQNLKRLNVCTATPKILAAFDEIVEPIYSRMYANLMENGSLVQTRDLLLPKLMSGEIRLRDAERAVEVVA